MAHCNVHFFDGNIRNTILIDIITIGVKERNSIRGRYPRPSGKQALKTRKWHGLETIDWADISIRNFDQILWQKSSRTQYLRQDISERISISDVFEGAPISSTFTKTTISVSTTQLVFLPNMNSVLRLLMAGVILSSAFSNAFCPATQPCHSSSSLHVSSFSSDDMSPEGDQHKRKYGGLDAEQLNKRRIEFADLGSLEESSERKQRMRQEQESKQRFMSYGDDLWNMREVMGKLSRKLLKSINDGDREREEEIREELRQIEHQDPDLVYKVELENLQKARSEGRDNDAMRHSIVASAARSNLPQYNLDGLWVGK